jgi:hypothetical protein
MNSSELKLAVRQAQVISDGSFFYPYARLLLDRMKQLSEADKLKDEQNPRLLNNEAHSLAHALADQVRYHNEDIGFEEKAQGLIDHATKFLHIFED